MVASTAPRAPRAPRATAATRAPRTPRSTAPAGLSPRAAKFWDTVTAVHTVSAADQLILEEACRLKDRLDGLNDVILGKGVINLMHLRIPHALELDDTGTVQVTMTVDNVLSEARQQANVLKQLLTALRLPDEESGKKPQHRGARGAYNSQPAPAGKVTALDAARNRAAGNG